MNIESLIKEASEHTPDTQRALTNLNRLFTSAPEFLEAHLAHIEHIAMLFAYSQFLADFCIKNPAALESALTSINKKFDKKEISLASPIKNFGDKHISNKAEAVKHLRYAKKQHLLRITMRDITCSSIEKSMAELSMLAEALLKAALDISYSLIREKFGDMPDNSFSVIALGKLGAGELNYSSDIDIISVYLSEQGQSSGIFLPSGVRANRIEPHEYFSRLTETISGLLNIQTEDGIAYRVDMKLRPNGQKGQITLPLNSYITYYGSWGKTWERIALIRARPVAGDKCLGEIFIKETEPFVWKRSMDYTDIEEIKELKKKIDTIFDVNDIKKGYGGIREIEFFVHTFQLIYGGEIADLRTGSLVKALNELAKRKLLPPNESQTLSGTYFFLRRLEHILQMKDDVQTHALPSSPDELQVCAQKMKFTSKEDFLAELRLKRLIVRDMYNSLFGGPQTQTEAALFFEEDLPDNVIRDYLNFKGFKDPDASLKNIKILNELMSLGKTIRERHLLRKVVKAFIEQVIKSENKDRALSALTAFMEKIGGSESYADLMSKRSDTREILIDTFVQSTYLTRLLMGIENLEGIFEYPDVRMDYKSFRERLANAVNNIVNISPDPMNAIREFRTIEEFKTGLLFIKGIFDVNRLQSTLSMIADSVIRAVLNYLNADRNFGVIALGRYGSGELNIGSDLDLIFIGRQGDAELRAELIEESARVAGEFIRFLTGYTSKGIAYRIDLRLRPDGTKGILTNDIDGYRRYYLQHARLWEIQALLRARPAAGCHDLIRNFYKLKKEIIMLRGRDAQPSAIMEMRRRIADELSKEDAGYNIKLGRGGIGEIEFLIEYLQLKYAREYPDLIIHKIPIAIKRLVSRNILNRGIGDFLLSSYNFMRTIETLLRLNEEDVLKTDSEIMDIVVKFLKYESNEVLIDRLVNMRHKVFDIAGKIYEKGIFAWE
jgi:glutamate-ammonia-ligase adenylyltransferase